MKLALGEKLEAASVHAVQLAGILQLDVSQLKATHIRKAEKSLLLMEDFLSSQMKQQAKVWIQRKKALTILSKNLEKVATLQEQVQLVEASLKSVSDDLVEYNALSEKKKQALEEANAKSAKYLQDRRHLAESSIVHRYERFQKMKALVPFADNAQFLCDAIHHYENRTKYEDNKERLIRKKEDALVRLANVNRGFYLALFCCLLIVTLPICAPFAYSLYGRKREISSQIANIDEVIRRENKRILAADEGVIAAQEIREVLGEVPLEVVRQTLTEVADLRREFMSFQPTQSHTAQLIHFLESEEETLKRIFGVLPAEVVEKIRWFHQNCDLATEKSSKQSQLIAKRSQLTAQISTLLAGRSDTQVQNLLASLSGQEMQNPCPWPGTEVLADFAQMLDTLPGILFSFRELMWRITQGHNVDENQWKKIAVALAGQANIISACSLELSLDSEFSNTLPSLTRSETTSLATNQEQ